VAIKKTPARTKRAKQPQTAPPISAYWRDRGFKWVVNGVQPRELVSGLTLNPTGGATTEVNHSGKALANRSTGVGWTKSISSSPAKEATLVWFGDFYTGSGANPFLAGILPNITDGPPYSNVALTRARNSSGEIGFFFADATGTFTLASSPNADYDGAKNLGIVAKIKSGSQKLFTNKRGLELTTTTALGGGGLRTTTPILVLGSGNPTRNAAASCSLFAVSDQFLTDEECLSLAKNPWQIFQQSPAKSSLWLNSFVPVLDAGSGSYSVTGASATLLADRNLNLESGSYIITGFASTLTSTLNLQASPGSYLLTGSDSSLLVGRNLNLESGSYLLSGFAATVGRQITLNAGSGAYSITLPLDSRKYVLKWYTPAGWQVLSNTP